VIDGGIIANNPALFSYMMQSKIKKKTPIRIFSMGTGISEVEEIDVNEMTRFKWLTLSGEFMIDIDVFASDNILRQVMKFQLEQA